MRTIKIKNNSKLRFWINDLPQVQFLPTQVREHEINAGCIIGPRRIACEILIAAGPRNMYGLLGGEFKPKNIPRMDIFIGSSKNDGQPYTDSIASPTEVSLIGIPKEYVTSIVEGFEMARQKLVDVGQGHFIVNHGVYGEIGSSIVLFKHLSCVLFRLLHSDTSAMSDGQITALLPEQFS